MLDYLGRYTHRIAISNNRLVSIDDGKVRFAWKDYRNGNRRKVMTLGADEFIRRFLVHVLPQGFQRIRYFGLLGNRYRKEKLARCRELLGMQQSSDQTDHGNQPDYCDRLKELTGTSPRECPACRRGHMLCIEVIERTPSVPLLAPDTS